MISIHEQITSISGTDFENLFNLLIQIKSLLVSELFQRAKQLTQAKSQFNKSKQTYEKICKSAEKHLTKFRKTSSDPSTKYNTVLLSTISSKVKQRLEQCNEMEKSLNDDQQNIYSQKIQLESKLKAGYEKVKETTVKVVQGVSEIASVWSDVNRTCLLWMGSGTDLIKKVQYLTFEEFEEEIEDLEYLKFSKIIMKQVSGEVDSLIFTELAENNIEKFQAMISSRNAIIKSAQMFAIEWMSQIDSFVKNGQKALRLWSYQCQSLSSSLSQKILIIIKIFQDIMEFWLKQFANLSQFLSEKQNRLGKIVKDQKNIGKNICNEMTKLLKDAQSAKNQYIKINPIRSLSDPDKPQLTESKTTQLKTEGDEIINEENKAQYDKVIIQTIIKMKTLFKDLYENEVRHFKGLQDSFESVMIQQCLIFNELSNNLNKYSQQNDLNKKMVLTELENFSQFNNKLKIYESEEIIKDKIVFIIHKFNNLPPEILQKKESSPKHDKDRTEKDHLQKLPTVSEASPIQQVQEYKRQLSDNLPSTNNLQQQQQTIPLPNDSLQNEIQETTLPSMIESTELRKDSEATEEDYSMINNYLESNNKVALKSFTQAQVDGYMEKYFPTKKKKVKSKYFKKFQIPITEKCLGEFSCGLLNKIILQGTLYVFQSKICFHSFFNDKNFLFGRTYQAIPVSDIVRIEKRSYMLFDSAICFITVDNCQLTFASFISRDKTFEIIKTLLKLVGKNFEFDDINSQILQNITEEQENQEIIEEEEKQEIIEETKVQGQNYISHEEEEEKIERKKSILMLRKSISQKKYTE